jgi:hypothetical protein
MIFILFSLCGGVPDALTAAFDDFQGGPRTDCNAAPPFGTVTVDAPPS